MQRNIINIFARISGPDLSDVIIFVQISQGHNL